MPVILGKRRVIDTKEYNDYAIGITLPIQIGNTAFNQSFTTAEQVKTNIKSLLLTKKYERLMQPNLGSGLQELLFEQNTDDLADRIEETINSALSTWLSQTNELKDNNRVEVSIKFRIDGNTNLEALTFNV